LTLRVTSPGAAIVTLNHSTLGALTLPPDEDPGTGRLYQTVAIPAAGTVTIGVQAPDGQTSGSFSVEATLNARYDTVSDGSATVQSLAGSTLDVDSGAAVLNRGAALGTVQRPVARILSETEGVTNDLRGSWDATGTNAWAINATSNPNSP